MRGTLENSGNYELFMTTKGHQILNLNNKSYFAVIKGQKGDMLIATDSDHQREKTLKKGKFYLADFDQDPEFRDLPHLFLQEGKKFREWILPNDKPSSKDYQKKLVKTGDLVSKSKVEEHVKGAGNRGSEKSAGLEARSKNDLYQMAKDQNIPGRSKMSREQLIKTLQK